MNLTDARRDLWIREATSAPSPAAYLKQVMQTLRAGEATVWIEANRQKRDITVEEKRRLRAIREDCLWLWDRIAAERTGAAETLRLRYL
jgi:hypothetical protein